MRTAPFDAADYLTMRKSLPSTSRPLWRPNPMYSCMRSGMSPGPGRSPRLPGTPAWDARASTRRWRPREDRYDTVRKLMDSLGVWLTVTSA